MGLKVLMWFKGLRVYGRRQSQEHKLCHVLKKVDSITTTFFLFFVTFFSFLVSTTVLSISFQAIDLLDNYAALWI